jgi:hypothetical protein
MRGKPGAWWPIVALLSLAACSGDGGPPTASPEARQNVMVIDEGIDLASPELRGKVVASFAVQCPDSAVGGGDGNGSGGAGGGAPSATFDQRKQAYLAQLATPTPSCHLVAGAIPAKADPLAAIAVFRDRWNGMVRGQKYANQVFSYPEWLTIKPALDLELKGFAYHGTATSGIVAHGNSGVRLVLVERQLAAPGSTEASFECLVQDDVDQLTAILQDPEVVTAYSSQPPSAYSEEFSAIVSDYNIGVVNESYGRAPRVVLEQLQLSKGCPAAVSLAAYFAAANALSRAWTAAHGSLPPYVWTQSAGNEGVQIDSPSDSASCTGPDQRHLLVGSTDLAGTRSSFSEFGACVDLYAPGEHVIAPYAGGWVFAVQGTSFAAPLVARLVSLAPVSPYDPGVAWQRAVDQSDGARVITAGKFPRDSFYAPDGFTAALTSALTSGWTTARGADVEVRPFTDGARDLRQELRRIDWNQPALRPLHTLLQRRARGPQEGRAKAQP